VSLPPRLEAVIALRHVGRSALTGDISAEGVGFEPTKSVNP
jgi:hypothetical protein